MADAADAIEWYALRSERAAADFIAELEHAIGDVAAAPGRWPRHGKSCRRRVLHRYPYLVLYRETERSVFVIAIAHGRRRPGFWQQRT